MVAVKLVNYRIKKLDMINVRTSGDKKISFGNDVGMELDFKGNGHAAVATMTLQLYSEKEPDELGIRIELEGHFIVKGADGSQDAKREAIVRCYDNLFPYVDQIVNFLAMNSALKGFSLLRQWWIDKKDVRQNTETKGGEGEIIEFPEDTDK